MRISNNLFKIIAVITLFSIFHTSFANFSTQPFYWGDNIKLRLSDAARDQIIQRIEMVKKNPYISKQVISSDNNVILPPSVQLGMNGVPVFDQGWEWGTCDTFAITEAIDALYSLRGDQAISQICYLQLTRSLYPTSMGINWWDSGWEFLELMTLEHYGYWTQQDQKNIQINGKPACGGLDKYPASSDSAFIDLPSFSDPNDLRQKIMQQQQKDGGIGEPMSISVFQQHSNRLFKNSDWNMITNDPSLQPDQVLQQIKISLSQGNRLVFSMYLDAYLNDHARNMGALAFYNEKQDTWVLTQQIETDIQLHPENFVGHDMVITGYDDNTCVSYIDEGQIKQECGLLKIRNSGGEQLGDHGDFYMSYDYFRALALDWVIAIGHFSNDVNPTQVENGNGGNNNVLKVGIGALVGTAVGAGAYAAVDHYSNSH